MRGNWVFGPPYNLCSFALFLLTYSMFYPHVVCYPSFLLFSHSESAKRNLYNNHVKYILKESPTLLIAKILSGKNARAWVSINFPKDKFSAPRTIEKMKILGALLELPAKKHCQSSPFTSKLVQIGQIGSAV